MAIADDVRRRSSNNGITQLFGAADAGDPIAKDRLYRHLYKRLATIASRQAAAHKAMTLLDASSLLQEAMIRMLDTKLSAITSEKHLLAYAAKIMRGIVVDHVRQQQSLKRYADLTGMTDVDVGIDSNPIDVLALNEGLERLALVSERLAMIMELRCFAGYTVDEIAIELDSCSRTIKRDWKKACAFIRFFVPDVKH